METGQDGRGIIADHLDLISSHCTHIFPDDTNLDCVLTAHADANTWSTWAEIEDNTAETTIKLSAKFASYPGHVVGMITEDANQDGTIYQIEIGYGVDKMCISSWRTLTGTNVLTSTGQSTARGTHIPAGETVYYRCKCKTAGSKTLNVHFRYFLDE